MNAHPVIRPHPDDPTKAELFVSEAGTHELSTARCALWLNILMEPVTRAAVDKQSKGVWIEGWGYFP